MPFTKNPLTLIGGPLFIRFQGRTEVVSDACNTTFTQSSVNILLSFLKKCRFKLELVKKSPIWQVRGRGAGDFVRNHLQRAEKFSFKCRRTINVTPIVPSDRARTIATTKSDMARDIPTTIKGFFAAHT